MEASASQFEVKPGVLHRTVEGEAVMLDLETGEYYGLNEVGTYIWGLLVQGCSLRRIYESVAETFETNGSLEEDVTSFLYDLEQKGLIHSNGVKGVAR